VIFNISTTNGMEQVSSYMIYPTRPDINIRKQLMSGAGWV